MMVPSEAIFNVSYGQFQLTDYNVIPEPDGDIGGLLTPLRGGATVACGIHTGPSPPLNASSLMVSSCASGETILSNAGSSLRMVLSISRGRCAGGACAAALAGLKYGP